MQLFTNESNFVVESRRCLRAKLVTGDWLVDLQFTNYQFSKT